MEFNRQTNEFGHAPPESTKPIEQMAFAPPPQPSEASKGAEYAPEPSAKQRPKPRRQRLSVSLLSALCAVVVGVGISSPMRQAFSPIDSAQVELSKFEMGPNGIYYGLNIESDAPLEVVLYNDFTDRRTALQNGENKGSFENLKPGMQYTLAVVGKGLFGNKELLSKKVTIKHPVEYASAEFLEYGGMEEGVFYHMLIRSTVPLKLVITDGTSRWEQPLVIEPDDGFWDEASAPPDSPYSGIAAGELLFPIDLNSSYTMMVVGDGLFQEHIVHAEPLPLFLP